MLEILVFVVSINNAFTPKNYFIGLVSQGLFAQFSLYKYEVIKKQSERYHAHQKRPLREM